MEALYLTNWLICRVTVNELETDRVASSCQLCPSFEQSNYPCEAKLLLVNMLFGSHAHAQQVSTGFLSRSLSSPLYFFSYPFLQTTISRTFAVLFRQSTRMSSPLLSDSFVAPASVSSCLLFATPAASFLLKFDLSSCFFSPFFFCTKSHTYLLNCIFLVGGCRMAIAATLTMVCVSRSSNERNQTQGLQVLTEHRKKVVGRYKVKEKKALQFKGHGHGCTVQRSSHTATGCTVEMAHIVRHTTLKSSLKVALSLQPPPNKLSFSGLLEKVIRFPNPLVGHRRS